VKVFQPTSINQRVGTPRFTGKHEFSQAAFGLTFMDKLGGVEVSVELFGDTMEETGLFNPSPDPIFFGALKYGHSVLGDFQCAGEVVPASMDKKP